MVYRRDLVEHFNWLAESEYLDEVLDEAVVAIALTAHGHGDDLVACGAAWRDAWDYVLWMGLEKFVDRARSEQLF